MQTNAALAVPPAGRRDFAPWNDPAARPIVRFEAVSKRYGEVTAVDRLSLDIYPGEFFALLGPSGCGKTTLLRMLAGFESVDDGRILLEGRDIAPVPPYRRPINMMFQTYALFPHMTVAGNIAFGLKQEGLPKKEIAARVAAMLAMLRLDGLDARRPHELSGGQRQRVALARALVKQPRVLLLDEPLAALDKKLREDTQFELMELQARLGLTFVIVTHDQEEAMKVADRIGVMDAGRLAQVAPPADIYERPASRWVADFIGDVNLIEARLLSRTGADAVVEIAGGVRLAARVPADCTPGQTLWLALRPEKLALAPEGAAADGALHGEVKDIGYRGGVSVYKVLLDNGLTLKATVANTLAPFTRAIGWHDRVALHWPAEAAVVLTQ